MCSFSRMGKSFGQLEEAAELAVFLASDQANFINGTAKIFHFINKNFFLLNDFS